MKHKNLLAFLLCLLLIFPGCASPVSEADAINSVLQPETFGDTTRVSSSPQNCIISSETVIQTETSSDAEDTASDKNVLPEEDYSETADTPAETATDLEQKLSGMTLEEKIAQLFIITPEALTGVDTVTMAGDTTKAAFDEIPVGGLIYFAQNLQDEDQVTTMLSNMQTISQERIGLPVFTGVDEEGGTVARIGSSGNFDVPEIPNMCEIGAAGDVEASYNVGVAIGTYLSRMGFNLDFAPDADVLSNPDNTVVKYRSFGPDPEVVSQMALAVGDGLNSFGVVACCKHFPGHGATEGDTHEGYAYTSKSLEELKACELIPFREWIEDNAGMIMVGHISLPSIIGDDTPSSLSSAIITDLLRNEMNFDGVVVTDALNMGAITQQYTSAEAAVAAIQAGADLLMTPENFHEAYQGVLDAVNNDVITEERINESVLRILKLKLTVIA